MVIMIIFGNEGRAMKEKPSALHGLVLPIMASMGLLFSACGPAPVSTAPTSTVTPLPATQVATQVPQVLATETTELATDQPAPVLVATSRGPDLVATDPSTVNLASGQLQLVEFFRFT